MSGDINAAADLIAQHLMDEGYGLPSGDVNAAAETPEVVGTVPSQWYLDLKVGNQALVAEVERRDVIIKADTETLRKTLGEVERLRESEARQTAIGIDDKLLIEQLRAECGNLSAYCDRLRAERDAARKEWGDAVRVLSDARGSFSGFLAPALSQALAEQDEEIDALRVEKQQLLDEVQRLQEALGGLDEPVQWIAENYPAVWWAMPSEFYRRFSEVRAALATDPPRVVKTVEGVPATDPEAE